ncbi:TonB-dependent receptor [Phenylobacterium sp.]|uniref:TonB-dependent receptor domain-containing protein n=1 Tax=Phenylobacterium sp. TaxID=1871053 RepID=UPI0025ED9B2A|nr:TonB-dependent receptor [Phenylobacterium sp.]MBX3485586.1 TonB-dependent receptor [Phenylobacterium sp.]MCW5758179.1 TonB-dependent receptor [Phenylobacterium sp.]
MSKGRFFCSASVLAALATLGVSGQAQAQAAQAAGQASSTEIGEVVVTGSFIRGTPEDAALPVDVISQEDLEKQGAPSTLELIKGMSVSSGVLGDTNQFDTRAQGSEGSGSINLRGLGAARTLVLLNGRRMAPNPFGQGASGIVDTNILPTAAIGRVEILKEGAAATYGSDAIGGVVNFITRTNFNGLEVGGSYKYIDGSKGDWDASAIWGHAWDNGNILLTAGYQHRSELKVIDRDFAVRSFAENDVGGWSGGSSVTAFAPITQTATGAWTPLAGFQLDNGCTPLGGAAVGGALPACNFHFSEYDNLIEHENRFQIYSEINADLSENHHLHVEALYSKTDMPRWKTSPSYLALQSPTALTNPTVSTLTPALLQGYFVPADNPGLIAYRAANPTAIPAAATGVHIPGVRYRPLSFQGNPIFGDDGRPSEGLRQYEAYRVSANLKGDLPFGGLGYDLAVTYGQEVARRTGYDTLVSRLQLALRGFGSTASGAAGGCTAAETNNFTTNAGNTALGCYYFNPFSNAIQANAITGQANPGYVASAANNPDVIRWFFQQLSTKQAQRLFVVDAVVTGETGIELGGGPVAWAAGVQFRNDVFESKYNGFGDADVTPCIDTVVNGSTNCGGKAGAFLFLATASKADLDQQVYAGFAEVSVPFSEAIQLQLAARYEDYNGQVGSTFNPKASLRWQITPWLAVRGGAGTTFRGPPLASLNPSTGTGFSFIGGAFRAIDFTGNPNLNPEKADNYTAGLIFNTGGLKATIDYWRFDFRKPIVAEPSGAMVAAMFPGGAATNCNNPAFAGLQARFTFSGGTCGQANISRVASFVVNGPDLKTSGIDFLADYDFGEVFAGGSARVGVSATYTINYKLDDFSVGGVVVQRGYNAVGLLNYQLSATPLPEWKGQAFAEYTLGAHNIRLTASYIDSYHDQRADVPGAGILVPNAQTGQVVTKGSNIKSTVLVDLDYRWKAPWDTTIVLSVDNLFDRDPSFARLDLNYDPFTGNPLGRVFKISAKKRF